MNTSYKTFAIGITLFCCLMAPQLTAAVSGCTNGYLLGTYNAQVSSMNLQNLLQAVNNTGNTTSPATTPTTPAVIGLGGNPRSLSGSMPGASRLYFDGNGTIVGATALSAGGTMSVAAGSYTVNLDCTATISLATGATFDAIVADSGKQVLFLETDSTGIGSAGTLQRASSCVSLSYPQSFGFSFSGATQQAASTTATGTAATATAQFMPYSLLGTISTDGNGSFAYTQTSINNGAVARAKAGGTYSVGADCSLKLNFSASFPGTTANFKGPGSLSGLTTNSTGGVLVLTTDPNTSYTGTFVVQ